MPRLGRPCRAGSPRYRTGVLGCRQSCPEAHSGLSPLPTGCPVPGLVGWGEKAGRGVPTDRMASQQQTDFSQLHTMNDPSCWREAETKPLVSGTRGVRTYAQTYMYTCTQACTRTHVCADTCLPCVLRPGQHPHAWVEGCPLWSRLPRGVLGSRWLVRGVWEPGAEREDVQAMQSRQGAGRGPAVEWSGSQAAWAPSSLARSPACLRQPGSGQRCVCW